MSTPGNGSSGSTPAARITFTASSFGVRLVAAEFFLPQGSQPPLPGRMTFL
ncbi:hypothetical protein [Streptomyces sp. LN785]|uniref:hypothetical protein n=1 Tax=Streptomyces sp. LN785 TaxID=3112983 RepID=UPI003717106E